MKNKFIGTFITDYVFSRDTAEECAAIVLTPEKALNYHLKSLLLNNLDVKIKEGRYSTKLIITYKNEKEYNTLLKWVAYHLGYSANATFLAKRDEKKIKDIVSTGNYCVF